MGYLTSTVPNNGLTSLRFRSASSFKSAPQHHRGRHNSPNLQGGLIRQQALRRRNPVQSRTSAQTVSTNNETASPLLHGEINCIQKFFAQKSFPDPLDVGKPPSQQRPNPRDCVFLATHEPCSLCLSGITWSGFDNFFYLFTYEDSRDLFSIPYDIDILQEVFRVPAVNTAGERGEVDEDLNARPLYNRRNRFFTARSFEDLAREVGEKYGEEQGARWRDEIARVKARYDGLSDTYQKSKTDATVESASFWK
ncbi:hypothetical protein RRF57_002032 [Xylaria bambusicola]|uniref:CMP/dCMP-type deaminase domain-containing protein n=1 Tax=Xylaria bambusicola TaxID=326684 RepID=A0AAN7Z232_9PEZI